MKSINVTLWKIYLLMAIYGPQFVTLSLKISIKLNNKTTFLKSKMSDIGLCIKTECLRFVMR